MRWGCPPLAFLFPEMDQARSGTSQVYAKFVGYEELGEKDVKWFRCSNSESFFESDQRTTGTELVCTGIY